MTIDKNGSDEFKRTLDDLSIPCPSGEIISAILTVTVAHEADDPGDGGTTPPPRGGSWVHNVRVVSVRVLLPAGYDVLQEYLFKARVLDHLADTNWSYDQDEWATRVWNERAQGEHDSVMESRADHARECAADNRT